MAHHSEDARLQGYLLRTTPASPEDAVRLRTTAGLTPKTLPQATAALAGTWYGCHMTGPDGSVVGMGRVIGDGGWYFHIVDMAVHPDHQRRGIGDAILAELLRHIRRSAPAQPFISLLADDPGRRLYSRHGFVDTAPGSLGMALPVVAASPEQTTA